MLNTKKDDKLLARLLEKATMPKIYKKGDIVKATIISFDGKEMLVDVGARTEGIISGNELKLEGEKLDKKEGDNVLVYVVEPENKEGRVELSIRKTGEARKWHDLVEAKENESPIKVKVIEANTGGVIVSIGGGLRGFIPSSQLNNSRIYTDVNYGNKSEATKKMQSKLAEMIDEVLEVKIMEINEEQNKVILSEKSVFSDESVLEQRNSTLETLKVGDSLTGKVTGIAPFGLFVNAEGLEGLVHLSEISWDKVTNPSDFYKIDEDIDVQVIAIKDGGKKIAYSIKRLKSDPWKNIVQKYQVGQTVEGVVSSIADYGAFVKVENGLNGLIHISELSHKLVKDPSKIVKEGENLRVMIISISHEDRHLGLSLKRLQEKPDVKEDSSSTVSSNTTESTQNEFGTVLPSDESSRELDELNKIIGDKKE